MDFPSFFEMHAKLVSVFCDCLIDTQWNRIRDDGICDSCSLQGSQVWEWSVTKWAPQHRMV